VTKRVVVYDATDTVPGPELADVWGFGAKAYRLLRHSDAELGARSWEQVWDWLSGLGQVDEVQYWGHGAPGAVALGGVRMDVRDLSRIKVTNLFWLRTCASFAGPRGKALAEAMTRALDCRVAGHTHNIGFWHSGLRTLSPDSRPMWEDDEGLVNGAPKSGGPWAPNTVTFLHGSFPGAW
jgi:hypothetical protein